ncbi:RHS repeat domain-containing protein [Dysgonomonas reticulitermitis]
MDGGYIEGGVYHYYLNDHLGNNRMIVNQNGVKTQWNHYYPFGTAFADKYDNGTNQPYKYNGKELDPMYGLNLYDYSARYMDAAIGRFTTVDPLAEQGYSWSPYAYCFNNPLLYTDPNGEWPFPSWEKIKSTAKAAGGAVLSFANGAVRAVTDNAALGTTNLRETGVYSNAKAYNLGQDVGDLISISIGTIESVVGGTEVVAGSAATVGSGGTAAVVSVPAIVDGGVKIVHGVGTVTSGANSLSSQKGRVSETSSNGNSSSSEKPINPKKAAREAGKEQRANQPASEDYAKYKAKELEKNKGKDARRGGHDAKDKGAPDRTKKQLDEDYRINK